MPIKFDPVYEITPKVAGCLMRIEAMKQAILDLPINLKILSSLRESARLSSVHYSTRIEGNRLTQEQVERVIKERDHFPGRERDEGEVRGYYAALAYLEEMVQKKATVTELLIQTLHSLAMNGGKDKVVPSVYRDGQNVIRDSGTHLIVYLPPEAKDVPLLMESLIQWIHDQRDFIPCPLIAAIAHYQFATIHPYYDGNGRTARLLTTFLLHRGGYDLKGLFSLEEYYARDLQGYYDAISIGPSHNYYLGRKEARITKWVEYFCDGVADSFEKVHRHAIEAASRGEKDQSFYLRELDPRQRKTLDLFQKQKTITAKNIGGLFGFKAKTSANICRQWVDAEFLIVVDASKKKRRYQLAPRFEGLVSNPLQGPGHLQN